MNFVVFPVGATNIFPLANSSSGGQLLSEFNIRSRESVETDPSVKYFIGKSFTHSMDDFAVYCQRDGQDITISNTAIQIQPGRALINGHYVESLTPVVIDINEANYLAQKEGASALKGKLAVGLRMAYSTYQTLAGSALVEDEQGYYEGVQVVVLPADAVKLPKDVPGDTQFSKVNMHLLLATFNYRNGAVTSVTQNTEKVKSIDASRVSNMDQIFSDIYVSKVGLDPNKIYTFSGKSSDGEHIDGRDTWCDSTDSLMVWDNHPTISTTQPSAEAHFTRDANGDTVLVMPHKQVDGMVNTQGTSVYYQDKSIKLPAADFAGNGGVVTPEYTRRVQEIESKINTFYTLPNGRMRQYIPVLTNRDQLPLIPTSEDIKWPYSDSEFHRSYEELRLAIQQIEIQLSNLTSTLDSTIAQKITDGVSAGINDSLTIKQILDTLQTASATTDDILERIAVLESKNSTGSAQYTRVSSSATFDASTQYYSLAGTTYIPDNTVTASNFAEKVAAGLYIRTDEQSYPSMEQFSALKQQVVALQGEVTNVQSALYTLQNGLNERIYNFIQEELTDIQNAIKTTYLEQLNSLESDLKNYIDSWMQRELDDRSVLTKWTWRPGDYVLVGQDNTVGSTVEGRAPTTMYVVRPGRITAIGPVGDPLVSTLDPNDPNYAEDYVTMLRTVPVTLEGGVEIANATITNASDAKPSLWDLSTEYHGAPGIDYFVARMQVIDPTTHLETWTRWFYTPTALDTTYSFTDPIWVTGGVPLATEDAVGGFVNVPSDAYGNGYVRLDENGYLRVMDFELLLTGVLAFQLGQNREEGAGLAIEEIQSILEDNVNDRVCFPNAYQIASATESGVDPHVIHLYLTLPEAAGDLIIHDIGSRYGSSLHVHILGSATSETTLTFMNCDKLRIDNDIEGAPTIILDNVNLYYDAEVIDACSQISNLTLWYQQYVLTDPDLQVDGMTVSLVGAIETTEGIDPWDSTYANDNHYAYSIRSITLGSDGSVLNVGLLVGDSTTANIDEGKSAFAAEFILPQSIGLNYPVTKMTHQIKVSGSFVSQYWVPTESAYMMKHTDFSAITQKYNPTTRQNEVVGTIAFYTDAELIPHVNGITPGTTVDCWDLNTPHYFVGGIVE